MASLDLSAPSSFPAIGNTTLSATPGNVRLVLLPSGVDLKVSIRPIASDCKLINGTGVSEDAAIGGAAYATLDGDAVQEFDHPATSGCTQLGIASASASVAVQVVLTRVARPL